MPDRRAERIRDLRRAIDCLPRRTRLAMLAGIEANPIILGAYTDPSGICPMLAAHRHGGRTDFIAFARAWDSFGFGSVRWRRRRPRRATERELLILRANLEASLLADEPPVDLGAALRDHRRLVADRPASAPHADRPDAAAAPTPGDAAPGGSRVRPGDPDRSRELRLRAGWRWMRVARNLDEYEGLLDALEREHAAFQAREALVRELELQLADS
jgi:hypothetical protein